MGEMCCWMFNGNPLMNKGMLFFELSCCFVVNCNTYRSKSTIVLNTGAPRVFHALGGVDAGDVRDTRDTGEYDFDSPGIGHALGSSVIIFLFARRNENLDQWLLFFSTGFICIELEQDVSSNKK